MILNFPIKIINNKFLGVSRKKKKKVFGRGWLGENSEGVENKYKGKQRTSVQKGGERTTT